jgi:PKHD-type hydroxylase
MNNSTNENEIKYDLWEYQSTIPTSICDDIIKKYDSDSLEYGTINNTDINLEVRKVKIIELEKTDWITSIFHYYGFDANSENFKYKISEVSNPQFLKYESGMFYNVHCDTSNSIKSNSFYRKLTVVLDLSDPSEYVGGDFILYVDGLREVKLNQSKGSIHIFPSYLNHKINPITEGVRYSMVSWILGEPFS